MWKQAMRFGKSWNGSEIGVEDVSGCKDSKRRDLDVQMMWRRWVDGSTRTSGKGSTQSVTSAFLTLVICIRKKNRASKRKNKQTDTSTLHCTPIPSLKPAVSTTTTGNSPISSVNSRTSRVVPGIGVTIDAERLARVIAWDLAGRHWVICR